LPATRVRRAAAHSSAHRRPRIPLGN
jgi:hypothetical protein